MPKRPYNPPPSSRDRRPALALGLIVLLALALRIGHLAAVQRQPYFRDPTVTPDSWYTHVWASDPNFPGHADAYYAAPLHMECLRLLYAVVGVQPLVARCLQLALGGLGPLLVYWIVSRIAPPRAALLSALLAAVYPVIIFYEGTVTKEAVVCLLTYGMFAAMSWAGAGPDGRTWKWGIPGIAVGLVVGLRPNLVIFPPLAAAVILLSRRESPTRRAQLARAAAFLAGVAASIAPITLRNAVIGKDPTLVSNSGGFMFYLSNRAGAEAGYTKVPDVRDDIGGEIEDTRRRAEAALGRSLRASEVSSYFFGLGWREITSDWAGAARRAWLRLLFAVNNLEVPNAEHYYFACRLSPVLGLPLPGFGVLLPWAVLGAWFSRGQRPLTRFVNLFVFCNVLGLIAFCAADRYRLLLAPCLILYAGIGLDGAWTIWSRRDLRRGAWACLVAGACCVAAFWPLAPELKADQRRPIQAAAQMERLVGHPRRALALLAPLVESGQGMPESAILAAQCRLALGEAGEARRLIEAQLPAHAGRYEVQLVLGQAALATGDEAGAEGPLRRAAALAPGEPIARFALARLRRTQGRLDDAAELLREALAINPDGVELYLELAGLASRGRRVEALGVVDQGLRRVPGNRALHALKRKLAGDR